MDESREDPDLRCRCRRRRRPASGALESLSWSGIWYSSHLAKMLLPVLLPVVTAEYSVGIDQAAIALTGFLVFALASKLIAGWLADHLPCKPLVAAATLGSALSLAMASQATSFVGLSLCWCLLGACDGLQFSAGLALMGRGARPGTYGKVHGLRLAVNALGTASAPLMVSVLYLDWRTLFLLTAGIAVLVTVGFLLGVRAQPAPSPTPTGKGLPTRALALARGAAGLLSGLIALQCLLAVVGQSVTSFTQQFLVTERQFDIRQSSALMTILMGVGILGPPLWGYLSDRFGRRPALATALLAHSACILAISLLPPGGILVASFVGLGLVRTAVYPVAYALISERFPASQGRIFGLSAALGHGAGVLGLLAVGFLAERHGFITVFPALAAIPLVGLVVVLVIQMPSREHDRDPPTSCEDA